MLSILNLSKNAKGQFSFLFILATLMLTFTSCEKDNDISPLTSQKYTTLDKGMHQLWADHMQWTYATVDAYFNNEGGLQAQLNRLLKNQENIGAAIVPYYGQAAGDQLTVLLKGHINGAVPVLQAARDNDEAALTQAIKDWRQNAQDIADFLSAANPQYWEKDHMRTHMDNHISETIAYSVDLLQKNYDKAVIDYDVAYNDMMHFASVLSEGIANQYPAKF